jgi:hypothetical protein
MKGRIEIAENGGDSGAFTKASKKLKDVIKLQVDTKDAASKLASLELSGEDTKKAIGSIKDSLSGFNDSTIESLLKNFDKTNISGEEVVDTVAKI